MLFLLCIYKVSFNYISVGNAIIICSFTDFTEASKAENCFSYPEPYKYVTPKKVKCIFFTCILDSLLHFIYVQKIIFLAIHVVFLLQKPYSKHREFKPR